MWMIDATPALFTDLYELTMAQAYFRKGMTDAGYFDVFIRHLPEHWGFFVMAGLQEMESYLREFRFGPEDIEYLRSTGLFDDDFLEYLAVFELDVQVRCLPEGTAFFPHEVAMEVSGPILHAQLLETYILNILGFSIIEASLATRMILAADGVPVVDFGMRRGQGPIATVRSARGAQLAGWKATSNVFAARELGFAPSGTMAHSFVQAHESEERAFREFAEIYGDKTILLVDTYDTTEGIKIAGRVAKDFLDRGVKLRGIRLDSGDIVKQSQFARRYFKDQDLEFLQVFVSGDLEEFRIHDLLAAGGQFDGFGVGTHFTVSRHSPSVAIVYKLAQYGNDPVAKNSPDKQTRPGRKSVIRRVGLAPPPRYERDIVVPYSSNADDLLKPFTSPEPMETVQRRLRAELAALPKAVKAIRNPGAYPVEFANMSVA
jgi:nicotinate phosphoribosyltransferase